MSVQQDVEKIKKELAELIIAHLKKNVIEIGKARQLAADFLAALPIENHKNLLTILKQLGEEYHPVRELYVEEMGKLNEEQKNTALLLMRQEIHSGNIEKAIQIAKTLQFVD